MAHSTDADKRGRERVLEARNRFQHPHPRSGHLSAPGWRWTCGRATPRHWMEFRVESPHRTYSLRWNGEFFSASNDLFELQSLNPDLLGQIFGAALTLWPTRTIHETWGALP